MITVQALPFTMAVVVEEVLKVTEKEEQAAKVAAEMVVELVMQPQMEQLTLVVEAVVLVVSMKVGLKVVLVDLVSLLLDIQHLNLIPQQQVLISLYNQLMRLRRMEPHQPQI
tara:strand:+ start:309 stop:644 length:336 start_codon:yes stop_codon:yes gene_type:complete